MYGGNLMSHEQIETACLTVEEDAKELGCAPKTVRKLINYGYLKAFKLGVGELRAPYRVLRSDLRRYIDRRKGPDPA